MTMQQTRILRGALVAVCGLTLGLTAMASWAGGYNKHKKNHQACYKTTSSMKNACKADAIDNFYVEYAKCINSEDERSCRTPDPTSSRWILKSLPASASSVIRGTR